MSRKYPYGGYFKETQNFLDRMKPILRKIHKKMRQEEEQERIRKLLIQKQKTKKLIQKQSQITQKKIKDDRIKTIPSQSYKQIKIKREKKMEKKKTTNCSKIKSILKNGKASKKTREMYILPDDLTATPIPTKKKKTKLNVKIIQ